MNRPFAALAAGLMLVLGAQSASAQTASVAAAPQALGLDGDWNGVLDTGPSGLAHVAIHIKTGTIATADSPDRGLSGLIISNLTRDGDKVRFEIEQAEGVYEGVLDSSGPTITGHWTQNGESLVLVLKRQ